MTKLDCTATNCVYNQNKRCGKDQVQVVGDQAHSSVDTCCQSFKETK